jgi:hypothetical protein
MRGSSAARRSRSREIKAAPGVGHISYHVGEGEISLMGYRSYGSHRYKGEPPASSRPARPGAPGPGQFLIVLARPLAGE